MDRMWFALPISVMMLVGGCQKDTIRLLCNPSAQYGEKVALEIDEAKNEARLLDPYSFAPVNPNPFKQLNMTESVIHIVESDPKNFWLLDRTNAKLSRNNPREDYYCSNRRVL